MNHITSLLLIIGLTTLLASCSTNTESNVSENNLHANHTESSKTVTDPHSIHDTHSVTSEESFLRDMIPHHQEAVDTSLRLRDITADTDIRALTSSIVQAQNTEIDMMKHWLQEWYPNDNTPAQYTPMMRDTSIISATPTIEKMWLEDMITHHEGAVQMANAVLNLNPRTEVREFAEKIIRDQSEEITVMQTLLHRYH